jgi:PAS domain S-box-containing protein
MEYDIGRPITHFAANFDYPDLVKDLQAVLDALLPHERHVRLTNGKTYQVRILPYRTSNNTIDGLILTFVDITRLVEMARELSEKENLYHTLMEMAPHCIWLADSSGKVIYLNPTRYGNNDPAAGDLLGDIWLQAIHPDDVQRVSEAWQQALQQDAVFRGEGRFLSKTGNYRHCRLLGIPIKNEADKTTHWAGSSTDITDFKQTEQELANREALLRRLYELAPIGMALITLNGRFVMANQTLLDMLGYAENEFIELSLQDLTGLEDTEEAGFSLKRLQTTGKYGPYYKECLHHNGHRLPMIFNGILYTHTDGSQYLWSFIQKYSRDD